MAERGGLAAFGMFYGTFYLTVTLRIDAEAERKREIVKPIRYGRRLVEKVGFLPRIYIRRLCKVCLFVCLSACGLSFLLSMGFALDYYLLYLLFLSVDLSLSHS